MKKNITNRVSLWQLKSLTAAVLAGLAGSVTHASLENHGDLEIYKGPQEALPVITLMLDVSGSMSRIDAPSGCQYRDDDYYYYTEDDYGYTTYYCKVGDNKYYRRIDNLKMGVSDLVDDPDLQGIVKVGIGTYPRQTGRDRYNGHIDIPAKTLDDDHKEDIDDFIKNIFASGGTPAAQAYAEAGAYMMGTTTNKLIKNEFTLEKETFRNNISPYPIKEQYFTDNIYSGFPYSSEDTKTDDEKYYVSPLPPSDKTCAGNGIYFLTDGVPSKSSATIATTVMDNALTPRGSTTGSLSVTCSNDDRGDNSGWSCMSVFADKLLNTDNPSGIAIKTATVGFGSEYSSLQNATTAVDCDAATDDNVKKLCNLGIKGQGGFYYAESAEDIVNSVKSLTGRLTTEIPPISTGSMAVPLDDLNVSTSRKFAYLPILDPDPLSPNKLWRGNLKKYNVKNGTLVDKSNKPIFTGKDGEFALNTSDLYNTIIDTSRLDARSPDLARPQVGGTYQHIFENNNSRKLFVNQGGTLKNIRTDATTAAAKPVGFDALAGYTDTQKQQLLNFLGFPVANSLTINDNTAIGVPFDRNKKQLGGVLHSLPQLISKKAALKADGSIDNTKREDYVLYGSLDGALHVVRDTSSGSDKAGEEVFTFIPKHVLEQQGASFVDPDTVAQNPIFGVDGPWSVFNNYKYSDTKVTALQTLAFGGLRMGGSMYYGLNLSDFSDPELIYSVGSTYAMDGSANAKGIKNDAVANATTNTSQQKAYARMGLSFAQPSVGYVMRDGKRVMVNFLAGGYDRCYEDPKFQLGSGITTNTVAGCNGKTAAQGNGIYMVQVGEEKVDSTSETNPDASNESSFDTTSGNGDLLWWTSSSNNGAGNANFTKVTDMNHSIVTEIRVLDRNYDGLTDQLVFADLGGRVWRVDINSAEDADDFVVERVTKLLDLSASGSNAASSGTDALPRIYEKPLVTFTRLGEGTDIVGLVTVGTGDRSSPVRAQRNVADRIYTFVDRDIARPDLFCYDVQDTPDDECDGVTTTLAQPSAITPADLVPLTSNNSGEFTNTQTIKTQMDSYTKLGWYLPLTMWSEKTTSGTQAVTTNNRGLKMFNQPDAIAGLLFTTVYNPNVGDTSGVCSAGVTGRTQREQLCLPYGVCLSKDVDSDGALTGDWVVRKTRYVSNAGIGIVDNIIADGNFDGDTKNSVVVLENYCEGGDCSDGKVNLEVNPLTEGLNCQGTSCQVVTDSRIDPMQWKER
ncbi:hypothetical protein ACTXIZ_07045 [Psychrobacter celer]|uniref:hypothetical protein n=1 Tax=Psychrobacter celer TaxID=306572 RepID=UPI003FD2AFCD